MMVARAVGPLRRRVILVFPRQRARGSAKIVRMIVEMAGGATVDYPAPARFRWRCQVAFGTLRACGLLFSPPTKGAPHDGANRIHRTAGPAQIAATLVLSIGLRADVVWRL